MFESCWARIFFFRGFRHLNRRFILECREFQILSTPDLKIGSEDVSFPFDDAHSGSNVLKVELETAMTEMNIAVFR
jgi:hypothetical protein